MIGTTLSDIIPVVIREDPHISDYPNTVIHFFADGSLVRRPHETLTGGSLVAHGRAWTWVWEPATGVSLDGTHQEQGIALSVAKEDARLLARKFAQTAFFWFDGEAFCVVPCDHGRP